LNRRRTGASRKRIAIVHQAIAAALSRISIQPATTILVAVSGGADSTALLHAMLELREQFGVRIAAAHLNHRLRGAESDRDENFVREMCSHLDVELMVERADGLLHSSNLEEQARDARHNFLNHAADSIDAAHIALAHHADDQAETVLMRLLRGAGVAGLAAMSECRPGRLIRPMLALRRTDIIAYIRELDLPYVEDGSNASPFFLRNRIRHQLLPKLEDQYAPGLGQRLVELAGEMRSLDELVTEIAEREIESMRTALPPDDDALELQNFSRLNRAVQAAVIRTFIAERVGDLRRFGRIHIDAILKLVLGGGPSDSIDLPGGWRAVREYNLLHLKNTQPKTSLDYMVPLSFDGMTRVEEAGYMFEASIISASGAHLPASPSVAMFDLRGVAESGLIVRNFSAGDRIQPLGMRGVKKVKSVFIDRKVPQFRRASFPVITLEGVPVWLPGLTRGIQAPVSSATETVLRVDAYKKWHNGATLRAY
jgi:tRNA(Ile)-lysidine synthase